MTLPGASPVSRLAFSRALAVCAIMLVAAAARGAGTEESAPSQNVDYQAGLDAIEASDWERAISNLNVAQVAEPTNADLQNWLGYAYRHEGRYDEAFDHFLAALQLDPLHRGAHLYIGETFLLTGDKAKAREHLGALLRICGTQCDEYRDLHQAIAAAK